MNIFPTFLQQVTFHFVCQLQLCSMLLSQQLILQLATYYQTTLQLPTQINSLFHQQLIFKKMGQTSFGHIDQNNVQIRQQLKLLQIKNVNQYQLVQKRDDQSIVIQNKYNELYYLLRIVTVMAEEDAYQLCKILQKRSKINSVHLCKIIAFQKSQQTLACSQVHRVHLLIECPSKSLKNLLQQKTSYYQQNNRKDFFHQEQLWGIAYSVVKALKSIYLYGMVHQSLSLESILIDEKGLVKVADPAVFGLEKNYISAMKQKRNCKKLLSPEILVFLDQFNFYFYEKEKSDIFIFGILLLQLCTLHQFPVYDFNQKTATFQLIQINLNQIKNKYSPKFYATIEWMTQIEPKRRPKLGQLLEFIDKNNSYEKSTQFENSVVDTSPEIHHPIFQQSHQRNKTISHFQAEPLINNHQSKSYTPIQSLTTSALKTETKQKEIKQKIQTEQSNYAFPFQLVYNRIINNNENMKPFQIQELCKKYRYNDMFGSSCRGSVFGSTFHAKIQNSTKQAPQKHHNELSKRSSSRGDLIYSQSSGFQGSNTLQFPKTTFGDIKLVQSNHLRQKNEPKRFAKQININISNIIQDANQHESIQSPYRRLKSQLNSEGKSLTSIRYLDDPFSHKKKDFSKSEIFQQYKDETRQVQMMPGYQNGFQSRYFSQENQNNIKNHNSNREGYQSQLLKIQSAEFHVTNKSEHNQMVQETTHENNLLMPSGNFNKESGENHEGQRRIFTFQSEFQSKLSRLSPAFAQNSRMQQAISERGFSKDFGQNQLIFVTNDVEPEGSTYTGYKSRQGLKQRHGKLQFSDGGYYEGQWKNDKMEGYGQLHYGDGALAYKGLWREGFFNGNGQIFNDKPEYFEESFNYLNFTEIEDRWLSYEGEFENDSKHGRGRINLTNGEYFEGMFDYDMIEGVGKFHTKSGRVIKGLWRDNELLQSYD